MKQTKNKKEKKTKPLAYSAAHSRSSAIKSSPSNASIISNIYDEAWVVLKKAGLKRTPNRENLLRFLVENHGPFSKDDIIKALPKLDMDGVTLYRNLAHFEEVGVLRRSEFGDGVSRYEFQAHQDEHHHHVVCTQCRRIDNIEHCALPKQELVVKRMGYSNIRHSLEFYGVCKDCIQKSR